MSIDEWLECVQATPQEARELRWYLAYLRWRKTVEHLIGLDASNAPVHLRPPDADVWE
ncbi:MAG: hypothetical protein R3C03_24050 [Pirellulaceae bacterium]